MESDSDLDPGAQPYPQTGTSTSQPTVGEAKKLLAKYRRFASDRDEETVRFNIAAVGHLPDKRFDTLEQLRAAVFEVLVERLKVHGLVSSSLVEKNFLWCLPTSLEHEDEWRLLLEDPLATSTHILQNMLTLETSSADSPDPAPKSNVFYIRAFTMRVRDIRDVCQGMLHDGYDMNPRIFAWLERIEGISDNAYFTLRYCGQSQNKPWDRHVSDIYSKSLKSFLGQFLKTVGMMCSDVLSSATVHVVAKASTKLQLDPEILDLREQTLIALFGDGVLNTEVGGKDIVVLSEEDHTLFLLLGTDTTNLLKSTQSCPTPIRSKLMAYARAVRSYVDAHPTTVAGKAKRAFSQKTERMIYDQGTFSILSDGSAVMVSLGSDIGDTHEEDDSTFFEAGGRAADVVTAVYNHFGYWEAGVLNRPFDVNFTKTLAKAKLLPFVDVFAWFVKHKDDYEAAAEYTALYMKVAKPFVVLSYGSLPTYVAKRSFASFTSNDYENNKKADQRRFGNGHWIRDVLGMPQMATVPGGHEFVLIPCCHPGLLGHVGILKEKLTRLMVMTSGIAWYAASLAVTIDRENLTLSRKQKCEKIVALLAVKLDTTHEFGRAFLRAKEDYSMAITAWTEGKWSRKGGAPVRAPPRGLLPGKTQKVGRARISRDHQTLEGVGDGFEVDIQEQAWKGASATDNKRYRLTWEEDDGQTWSIAPVILPSNVAPADSSDKRFLFYTPGGIDIRNNASMSLGDRKPITTGNTKLETLPIASLIISLSEQADAPNFFSHWEEATRCLINEVLGSKLPIASNALQQTANEGYYPSSFFENSRSKRTLPFTANSLSTKGYAIYLEKAKEHLPANPGDLLWLVDRFIQETLPGGGEIDLISASIHDSSVYKIIASFCAKGKYKHHPHLQTFFAFASMAEMGQDERNVSSNALTMAAEILRGSITKKKKTANIRVGDERRSAFRYVLVVGRKRPQDVIREEDDPELERDVEIIDDVTDDEDEEDSGHGQTRGMKRGRDDDDNFGEGSSKASAKAAKGAYEEEEEDDMV